MKYENKKVAGLSKETLRELERIAMEDPVSPRRVSIYADLKEGASVRRLA